MLRRITQLLTKIVDCASDRFMCLGLLKRLQDGEDVICAEGYIFEFERRGYLKAGHFVPEVVIEHPHLVKNMHEEFVHSGSDVVQAFTVRQKHLHQYLLYRYHI